MIQASAPMDKSTQMWLNSAVKFFMGESDAHKYKNIDKGREVYIETRKQRDGSTKWCVAMDGWCLGKDGKYYYESQPSSRTPDFLALTRFETKEEAYNAYANYELDNFDKNPQLFMD